MANKMEFVASAGSFQRGLWWALLGADLALVIIGILLYGQ